MQDQHSPSPRGAQQRRPQPTENKTTENTVEAAIVRFLRDRGWLVERNQVGLLYTADGRPCPVGRRGQCDWRAMRPVPGFRGCVHHFEVEVKRPGGKPSQVQREYMALRTHQGFIVVCADSLQFFQAWYAEAFGDVAVRP